MFVSTETSRAFWGGFPDLVYAKGGFASVYVQKQEAYICGLFVRSDTPILCPFLHIHHSPHGPNCEINDSEMRAKVLTALHSHEVHSRSTARKPKEEKSSRTLLYYSYGTAHFAIIEPLDWWPLHCPLCMATHTENNPIVSMMVACYQWVIERHCVEEVTGLRGRIFEFENHNA